MKASEFFALPASLARFAPFFPVDLPPWEWLKKIGAALEAAEFGPLELKVPLGVHIEGRVWLHPSVKLPHTATLIGPAYIAARTEIRPGAFIRGNVIVGEGCVLGNSSEFKNCLLMEGVQAPHYNYVGDSILGNKAHLGAGAICSNLRLDQGEVQVKLADGTAIPTGLRKFGAVLGDKAIVAASWLGSPGESVHRYALPEPYRRKLRVHTQRPGLAVPAELRDLPMPAELDTSGAVAKPDTGKYAVGAVAIDPIEPTSVYAATLERVPDDTAKAGIARLDLATRTWNWYRGDGCGTGTPVALAAARELVACGARDSKGATVFATTRDGSPLWQWRGTNVDAMQAAADVVLVFDADRLHVLDGRDGKLLATYTSDDGGAMRAAALDVGGMAMVAVFQRGLVMARLPRVEMVPAWTLAVGGVVGALVPAGDGVLVALEDGDAYQVDARTGTSVAMPGLDLLWGASGDLVTGQAPGGPVPPAQLGPGAPKLPAPRRGPPPPPRDPAEDPPLLPKPWPEPPPMPASWQYTLYELSGALRARNDYALDAPITPAPRGPGDSPLVVQYGPGLREILVVEPRRGDPLRRVHLPDDAAPGTAFATLVDGKPVVGTLLLNPLRAVLF